MDQAEALLRPFTQPTFLCELFQLRCTMARPASKKEKTFTSYESLARELLPSEENPDPDASIEASLLGQSLAAASVALVWRRSWNRTPSRPTDTHAGSHTRLRKFSRRSGVPSGMTNTRPSTPGSLQRARCSTMASQMNAGSTTVRAPAAVF